MNIVVKDERGRKLLLINDKGKIAVTRLEDIDEKLKNYIVDIFVSLTGGGGDKLMKFLNFEEDNDEFCS